MNRFRIQFLFVCAYLVTVPSFCIATGWGEWAKESSQECAKHLAFQAIGMVVLPFVIEKSTDLYYYAQGKENPIYEENIQKKNYLKYKTESLRLDTIQKKQEEIDGEEIIAQHRIKTLHLLLQNASNEQEREKYKKEYDAYVTQVLARIKNVQDVNNCSGVCNHHV